MNLKNSGWTVNSFCLAGTAVHPRRSLRLSKQIGWPYKMTFHGRCNEFGVVSVKRYGFVIAVKLLERPWLLNLSPVIRLYRSFTSQGHSNLNEASDIWMTSTLSPSSAVRVLVCISKHVGLNLRLTWSFGQWKVKENLVLEPKFRHYIVLWPTGRLIFSKELKFGMYRYNRNVILRFSSVSNLTIINE